MKEWEFVLKFDYQYTDGDMSIVNDSLKAGVSAVIYMNDKIESTLYPFRHNDVMSLSLKYGI